MNSEEKSCRWRLREAALKKETDKLSAERLENLQKELAEQRESFAGKKLSGTMKNIL